MTLFKICTFSGISTWCWFPSTWIWTVISVTKCLDTDRISYSRLKNTKLMTIVGKWNLLIRMPWDSMILTKSKKRLVISNKTTVEKSSLRKRSTSKNFTSTISKWNSLSTLRQSCSENSLWTQLSNFWLCWWATSKKFSSNLQNSKSNSSSSWCRFSSHKLRGIIYNNVITISRFLTWFLQWVFLETFQNL